jgi:hypothetical protein
MSVIAAAFDDYFTDVPHEYSDDSALPSDDENEEMMSPTAESILTPVSLTSSVHQLDLPSRFTEPTSQDAIGSRSDASKQANSQSQKHEAASEIRPVSTIEGSMMSWWPLPLDLDVYDWAEKEEHEIVELAVPESQHVSSIEGPYMSWWPMPMGMENYDWDERFYE